MRKVVTVIVALIIAWRGGTSLYHHFFSPHDINEAHTLTQTLERGITAANGVIPMNQQAGKTVYVQCQWNSTEYVASNGKGGQYTMPLVFNVTVDQLDSTPRGPFKESCEHWGNRHKLTLTPND
jgi:hypothetical protein